MKTAPFLWLLALLPATLITGVTLFQVLASARDLPGRTLRRGRIVLVSDQLPHGDPHTKGGVANVLDGDPNTAAVFRFPSAHPHGAFLLMDLALSHWPAATENAAPRARKPEILRIHNGLCRDCPRAEFERHARIRRAQIHLLQRRANDPDKEFVIPEARVVFETKVNFPDHAGPVFVNLDLPFAAPSVAYPENTFYIICKLTVLEIYPGTEFKNQVAVAEVAYGDRLKTDSEIFYWGLRKERFENGK